MSSLRHLEFDTEIFGIPTARMHINSLDEDTLRQTLQQCADKGIGLVFWTTDMVPSPIMTMCYREGHFFDNSRLCFSAAPLTGAHIRTLKATFQTNEITVSNYTSNMVTPGLYSLALMAGMCSRFSEDPNVTRSQMETMYQKWVENCVVGANAHDKDPTTFDPNAIAHAFFIAKHEMSGEVGFVGVKKCGEVAKISLIACSTSFKGCHIGTLLIANVLQWAIDNGMSSCDVVASGRDIRARKMYERCGFQAMSAANDIHFWLRKQAFPDLVCAIPNNRPYLTGNEVKNVGTVLSHANGIHTHAKFGPECEARLERELGAKKVLLVGSGTAALEMCSMVLVESGDEVIMPSYTFVSTANAFVVKGAVPVFVDIRSDTQNIDETKIEAAITPKTKAICVVHYAGVPCEMDTIMEIATRRGLVVIEDNAHGIFSLYKGRHIGTIGHMGALSFHYTKNLICGEGGGVIINDESLISKTMVAWEKGTNRFDFMLGKVDK